MFLVLFLLINAVFWGLFSHKSHCELVKMFGISYCPEHYIHLLMGLCFYIAAVYVQQQPYINYLKNKK